MGATSTLDTLKAGIPPELMDRAQWVLWKAVPQPGKPKPRKVPFDAKTGRKADPTNPADWASFEECAEAFEGGGYDGLGYCFSAADPYCGVDFDDCVSGGQIDPWVREWLLELDSWSEYSHSGEGIHVIVKGKLPAGGNRKKVDTGNGRAVGIEMYDKDRYFALTGNRVPKTPKPIFVRQDALNKLHRTVFGPQAAQQTTVNVSGSQRHPQRLQWWVDDRHFWDTVFAGKDGDLLRELAAGDSAAYSTDHSACDQRLCNALAFYTGGDAGAIDHFFRQTRLYRPKWERQDYRERTIETAIKTTTKFYAPRQVDPAAIQAAQSLVGHSKRKGSMGSNTNGTGHSRVGKGNGAAAASNPGSTAKSGAGGGKGPKQADLLYELAARYVELFTNQEGEAYVTIPINTHKECHRLRSKAFRDFLTALFYNRYGTIPGSQSVEDALRVLSWDASGKHRDVYLRVAGYDDKIYIDLGGPKWDAIEVDAAGWRIVDTPPVAFWRPKSTAALPYPTSGGKLDTLRQFMNIEDQDWPLMVAYLVAALYPTGPYPIATLVGEHGTAKTTTIKAAKLLIDPSLADLRGQPDDVRDLMVGASNNWLLAFDNMSRINSDISDALCRISTGGAYARRALYQDGEEFIVNVTRPMMMNSITDIVNRPDLMDRALLFELPTIPESQRVDEHAFWTRFEQERPAILGALLDVLAAAIAELPHVKLDRLPRMADFAKLGTAMEGALGLSSGEFLRLYNENRDIGVETILEASVLTKPLEMLVVITGKWQGTPTDLLIELAKHATDAQKQSKEWPSSPKRLTDVLIRLAPSLRQNGIVDCRYKRSNGTRQWTIERMPPRP